MVLKKVEFKSNRLLYRVFALALVVASIACVCEADEAGKNGPEWVKVDRAIDGDTIILRDGRHVRLIGIDAPEIDHRKEKAEPWAVAAWQAIRRQVDGQKVRLEFDVSLHDAHGRVLAYLFDQKGDFINQQVIEQGLAYVLYVAPDTKAFETLLTAQRLAIKLKKGMWQDIGAKNSGPWVGNRHSRRFHTLECPLGRKMHPGNRIDFNFRLEAFRQGYAPCKRCNQTKKKELKLP